MIEDIKEAKAKHTHNVRCQGKEEEEEVTVVPATNTVVHPGAVMVKFLKAKKDRASLDHSTRSLFGQDNKQMVEFK